MNKKDVIEIYTHNKEEKTRYLELETYGDDIDLFEEREKQGFQRMHIMEAYFSKPDNKCIELYSFRKDNVKIVEIWDPHHAFCRLAFETDYDLFKFLGEYIQMKKNLLQCEKIEIEIEKDQ